MKKIYTLIIALITIVSVQSGYSQCSILTTATTGSITLSGGSSYTKFSATFNPVNNLYYTLNGNYIQTHNASTGALLNSYYYSSNMRSIWWNSTLNQLEGNGYNTLGIVSFSLNTSGYVISATTVFSGSNHQPYYQSQGAFNSDNNEIVYFYNNNFYRYSRSTGNLLGTVPASGFPGSYLLTNYNVVYVGCAGKELGLYDRNNRRLLFFNKANGAYVGYSQLPTSAATPYSYGVSFSDNKLWVSNGYSWSSYSVLNYGLQTSSILGPFCDSSTISVNFSINSLTFNTGNVFTAQLSNSSGSFTVPTTIGTVTSTTASTISAMIPVNTPAGSGYRIRVVSSNPVQVGTHNGTSITVNVPDVNLGSNVSICPGDTATLTAPYGVLSYNWSSGATTQVYGATTAGTYQVTVSNGVCSKSDTIVVSALPAPSPTLPDTTTLCGNSTVLSPGSFSSYLWSTGATSSTLTASNSGNYSVTVTGSNTCTTADNSFVNLLQPAINTGDTTICAGDTLDLNTASGCYFVLSSITNTSSYNATSYYAAGDDRGGIAVTQNYLYYTGDNYTARYNTNLTTYTQLSQRDGIFSDLSTGQLYTFWSSTYNGFTSSNTYTQSINSIRKMDASLNYTGSVINLSQTINAGYYSYVFAGSGYVVIWSNNDQHFYKIELPSGTVTDLGTYNLANVRYTSENWASWGTVECNSNNYSFVFRANSNSTYGTSANEITRFDLATSTFSTASSFTNYNLGDMACFTYSPWNSRWYFQSEYSTSFGSLNENIGYASGNHNGAGGSNSINNFAWSTGATTPTVSVTPATTTSYSVTITHGTTTCSDTVAVTVNSNPTFALADTMSYCNVDSIQITTGGSFSSYEWSTGVNTQTTYVSDIGTYFATVTNTNNCASSDSTYVNLLDARIDQVDTTICSSDSLELALLGSCGLQMQSFTVNNLGYSQEYSGDDRGGIAVTPNYVYSNGDSYCTKYNLNLGTHTNYGRRDGIFSDLGSGQLYTFWNTTYNNFTSSSTYINNITSIRKMDANLNYGTTINLSQPINAGYNSVIAAGTGYVILWSNYDKNFYKIDLSNGDVETLGNSNIYSAVYNTENWASWGVAECGPDGNTIVVRSIYNYGSGAYSSISRFKISSSTWEEISYINNLNQIDVANFTFSPWNNRWYFTHEYSLTGFGTSNYENIVYADASSSNYAGGNGSGDILWSNADTNGSIIVSPNTTTNYSVAVTNGSHSCADTVAITVITSPTVTDTANALACFGDTNSTATLTVSGGTTPYTYLWSNSATTNSISSLAAGMYAYTVTAGNNCTILDSIEVTSPSQMITGNTINSSASCFTSTNGSATVNVTGGTPTYSYLWPSGGVDTTDTQVGGGENIVTITDASSCVVYDTVTMTSPSQITSPGPITSTTTFYCPGTTGTLVAANGNVGTVTSTLTRSSSILSPTPYYNSNTTHTFTGLPASNGGNLTLTVNYKGLLNDSYRFLYVYDENGNNIGWTRYTYSTCSAFSSVTFNISSSSLSTWLADGTMSFMVSPYGYGSSYCAIESSVDISYSYSANVNTHWFSSITNDTTQSLGSGATYSVTPQTTTTYYAASFSAGCNSTFDSITVIVPPAPTTAYLMNPTAICPGETTTVSAYGAVSYTWPTGDPTITGSGNSATITPTATTDYLVTITNAFNCQYVDTMHIPVHDSPNGNVLTTTNVTCSNASDGQAVVYATGGTSPYVYNWSNGNSGALQLSLGSGNYIVTITDGNTCSDTMTVTVGGPIPMNFNATINDVTCNGVGNGSISLATTGGNSPYTYSWSSGQTTSSLSNLSPGSYAVTVTDNTSCVHDTTFTITQPLTLVSSISGTTPETCAGLNNGSINSASVGGTSPYTYAWSNGGSTAMLNTLAGGTYTLTVTDANGCTSTTSGTVVTTPTTLALSVGSVSNVLCYNGNDGAAVAIGTGGSSPYNYSWSNGGSAASLSNATAGTYSVTITDNNSCQEVASVTVTEPTQLVATNTIFSNATCNGLSNASATVAATGATPTYTFAWPDGTTSFTNTTLGAGTFIVTITDANLCTDTTAVTVTEPAAIVIAPTVVDISCNGLTDGSISAVITGGSSAYSYAWSNGAATNSITGLATGTYSLTITDANNCQKDTTLSITQPNTVSASMGATSNIACKGGNTGSATAVALGGVMPYSYAWSNASSGVTNSNMLAGLYIVTITDANGCNDTTSVTLTEPAALLSFNITDSTNVLCNADLSGSATAVATGGGLPYSYSWSNGGVDTIISNLAAGNYTASVTDSYGCSMNTAVTITEPTAISLLLAAQTNVTCFGANNGAATIFVSGGAPAYSYAWSNSSATNTISSVGPGAYVFTVTDANNCTGTATITITEPTALDATITNSQNVACNGSATGFAVVDGSGGTLPYSYAWSTGSTVDSIYNQSSGFYTVTITDANGCIDSALANLTQPTSMAVSVNTSTNNLCFGDALGSAQVQVSGGATPYNYAWPTGASTNASTALTSGSYVVTVTDANNCQDTTLVTISEPNDIVTTVSSQINPSCFGDQNGSVGINVTGGVSSYTYLWSNTDTDTLLNSVNAGTYSVVVTDNNNCTDTLTVNVTEPADLVSSATVTDALCNTDTNGMITTTVAGGSTPYNYSWSNSSSLANAINLGAATYTVTITDANGCADTLTNSVTEPMVLTNTLVSSTDVNCFGDFTGIATTSSLGGTTPYSYAWSGGQSVMSPTNLGSGLNTLIVTDANGCIDTTTLTLYALSNLDLTIVSQSDVLCNGDTTANIAVTATGGSGILAYTWSVAGTDSTLLNQGAGSYSSYVTDNLGCSDTLTITVTQPAVIAGYSVAQQNPLCFGDSSGWAQISALGGVGSFSYLWPSGDTLATDSLLTGGVHMVTITDSNSCSSTYSVYLTDPTVLSNIGFNTTNISCYFDVSGSVVINPTGGTLPYSTVWSNGQVGNNAIGLSGGTYSAIVTDANGCILNDTTTISSSNPLTPSQLPNDTTNCGGDVTLSANAAFTSYSWSTGSSSSSVTITNTSLITFTGLDANGCNTYDTVQVNILPAISVNLGADIYSICEGTVQVLDAGNRFVTYQWSTGDTTSTSTISTSGTYFVTATDTNGCSATDDVMVTMWALPVVDLGADTVGCTELGVTSIDLDAGTGFTSYLWSTGATIQTESVTTDGDYSVIVENNNGCFGTDTINVKFDICNGINDPIANNLTIKMYPNPTKGDLNIDLNGFLGQSVEIEIMTTNGQVIRTKKMDSNNQTELNTQMDLNNVAQGLYFVVVKSGDQVKVERITIY